MDLENFNKVSRVEVPPFLFTRIQQKIENEQANYLSKRMELAIKLCFASLLLLNSVFMFRNIKQNNSLEAYAESISLVSTNTLYE